MKRPITSLRELYAEKRLLKSIQWEHEEQIKENFQNPRTVIGSMLSFLKLNSEKYGEPEKVVLQNILIKTSILVVPLAVNMIKKPGIILNSLMLFLSVKAAQNANTEAFLAIGNQVKNLFDKRKRSTGFKAYRKPIPSGRGY